MFATNPAKAKQWAKETPNMKSLPDKKHPEMNPEGKKLPAIKTAADGRFFEKRSQPFEGNFFRDMSGREDGAFYEKGAQLGSNIVPRGGGINVSPPGSQMFGAGDGLGGKPPKPAGTANVAIPNTPEQRGKGMGGGMYLGTGKGVSKEAGRSPSDWDSEGLPTGFHRPASAQPEELESGGNRFHSTDSKGPDYGVGDGIKHGLHETGRLRMGSGGSQMGKHAAPRFLGTSYGISKEAKSFAGERSSEFTSSLKEGVGDIAGAAGEGLKSITKSPAASLVVAALLGRAGFRGAKGVGRVAKKGYKRARYGKDVPDPEQTLTATEKMMGGARSLGEKLKLTT